MTNTAVHARLTVAFAILACLATTVHAQVSYINDVPFIPDPFNALITRIPFIYSSTFTPLPQGQVPDAFAPLPQHTGMLNGVRPQANGLSYTFNTLTGTPVTTTIQGPYIVYPRLLSIDEFSDMAMYYDQGAANPGLRAFFFNFVGQLIKYNQVTHLIESQQFVDSLIDVYSLSALNGSTVAATGMEMTGATGGFLLDPDTGGSTKIFSDDGGSGLGQFNNATFLSYGADGMLYVLDYGNRRVQELDPSQGYASVFQFGIDPGVTDTQFSLSSAGDFYFGNGAGGGYVYDKTGHLKEAFTLPSGSYTPGGAGNPYTMPTQDNTLLVYDPTGVHLYGLAAAPEPASLALFAMATLPIVSMLRRRKR